MPRVLLIHFHFPPDGLVGTQITAKFAKYLPDCGWDPFVLTARPHYYERIDPTTLADVSRPAQVYRTARLPHPRTAYRWLKAVGRRAPVPSGHARPPAHAPAPSRMRRVLRSLMAVPDDAIGWVPPATRTGLRVIRRHHIDCLFSSGPPWTNHLVASSLRRLTGRPWVACFEDPWTLIKPALMPQEVSALSLALERRLERAVVETADAVVCLNDRHRRAMIAQFPASPPAKFHVIPNGFDPADFDTRALLETAPPPDRFVMTHTGTLYYGRTPRELFLAIRRLLDCGVVSPDALAVRFIGANLLGDGRTVEREASDQGLASMVEVRPPVEKPDAIRAMFASHLLLVLAHDWVLQVPAKLYEYLPTGRPILALAPEGATADLVRASGAGSVVDPSDVGGIAQVLADRLSRFRRQPMPDQSSRTFADQFDRRRHTAALAALLDRVRGVMPAPSAVPQSQEVVL